MTNDEEEKKITLLQFIASAEDHSVNVMACTSHTERRSELETRYLVSAP